MAGGKRSDFSWKKELVKLAVIGVAALCCLLLLVNYPSLENILFSKNYQPLTNVFVHWS